METEKSWQDVNQEDVSEGGGVPGGDINPDCQGEKGANVAEEEVVEADLTAKMAEEVALWRDKYMRLQAEFDNFRKRTLKEKMDLVSSAGEDVIKSLLPVLDDLDRALEAMETSKSVEAVKEGVVLISGKLRDTLRGKGLSEIESLGKELDTDFHEAIAKIPAPGKKERGKVVDVVQKGYKLNDKVIRHSKVVVGE